MSYIVELRPAALRDLKRLPKDAFDRLNRKITSLADDARPPGVEKLAGSEDCYRVRVGDYRILYTIRDDDSLITVARVRHRREVYRR